MACVRVAVLCVIAAALARAEATEVPVPRPGLDAASQAASRAGRALGAPSAAGDEPAGDESNPDVDLVLCTIYGSPADEEGKALPKQVVCNGTVYTEPELLPEGSPSWWRHLLAAMCCIFVAAFAAGLTLGLTSLDEFGLRVLCNRTVEDLTAKDPAELARAKEKLLRDQRCARQILPLVSGSMFGDRMSPCLNPSNTHCLLVTLLLSNAAANEALPLFFDRLVPSWLAIILSVSVVLLFGEILPSAIFTGPRQLQLAAKLSPAVRLAKVILFPIVWPISLVLDMALGHVEDEHSREEMKAMARTLQMQGLERDEVNMIHGVLEMHNKTSREISQDIQKAKMLAHDALITKALIDDLVRWGHSRVFVYKKDPEDPNRKDNITNVLIVKKLLAIDLQEGLRVENVSSALKTPLFLNADDNLLTALNKFQDGMCHLALVKESPEGCDVKLSFNENAGDSACVSRDEAPATMFCSLEDLIESMLKEDIFDEADEEMGRCPAKLTRAGTSVSSMSDMMRLVATPRLGRRWKTTTREPRRGAVPDSMSSDSSVVSSAPPQSSASSSREFPVSSFTCI